MPFINGCWSGFPKDRSENCTSQTTAFKIILVFLIYREQASNNYTAGCDYE